MKKRIAVIYLGLLISCGCDTLHYISIDGGKVKAVKTQCGSVNMSLVQGFASTQFSFKFENFENVHSLNLKNTVVQVNGIKQEYEVWWNSERLKNDRVVLSEGDKEVLSISFEHASVEEFHIYSPDFISNGDQSCALGPLTIHRSH